MGKAKKAKLLLSTDTLTGYGLDVSFQLASDLNYDGIDLAIWKNFDARNVGYVSKLVENYKLPVEVIQVSSNVNVKEMNQALDLARELDVQNITINAPLKTNYKTYKFITQKMAGYKRQNPKCKFSIINPPKSNLFMLPIDKYYFTSLPLIYKQYKYNVAFDVTNVDEIDLENKFLKNISSYLEFINVVYLSDKDKNGVGHKSLGDGYLKLEKILKKFKANEFYGYFSLKLDLTKKELSDYERVEIILKQSRLKYKEFFEDITIT